MNYIERATSYTVFCIDCDGNIITLIAKRVIPFLCHRLTICNGSPNAELEDCYEKSAYEQVIQENFGVSLNVPEFRNSNKWSDRVANCFKAQGKPWSDAMEKRVKLAVATAISADPTHALNQHKRTSIDALVTALEAMMA